VLELDYYKVPNIDPLKCVTKVANKANLAEKTKRQALYIMEKVTENEILSAGKDPMGLAATVLYISCIKTGENISQKDISHAAGVTDATLRNRFKDLKNHLTELGDSGIVKNTGKKTSELVEIAALTILLDCHREMD
jgi:transcription initiation factor TFIIB